jgi:hypothetical protein
MLEGDESVEIAGGAFELQVDPTCPVQEHTSINIHTKSQILNIDISN